MSKNHSIKRGVSLYSFQEKDYLRKDDGSIKRITNC